MTSRKTSFYLTGLVFIACGFGTPAQAQDTACRVAGTFTIAGQTTINDQCLQNHSMAVKDFRAMCDLGKDGVPALGIPPMKPTYLAACPGQAISACENFAQGKLTSYVYGKDNVADPAGRKQGCEKLGGKFR